MFDFNIAVDSIRERGFYILRSAFDEKTSIALKTELQRITDNFLPPPLEGVPFLNSNSQVIYNPDHKSKEILLFILRRNLYLHQILKHFLNDPWYRRLPKEEPNYILRAAIARSSGPDKLPMHIDSFVPSSSDHVTVMQALFALDISTVNNGATIIVPGSHISDKYAIQDSSNVEYLELNIGDIAIWDSRLWHGALPNKTGKDRWALVSTFTRWWIKQNYQKPRSLPDEFLNLLSPAEKTIMGCNSYPPFDEYERIDIKKGHSL